MGIALIIYLFITENKFTYMLIDTNTNDKFTSIKVLENYKYFTGLNGITN